MLQASGLSDWAEMAVSNRRVAGLVTAVAGVLITFGHFLFGLFDRVPEKYHSHQAIVATGFGLMILGLVMLGTEKKQ